MSELSKDTAILEALLFASGAPQTLVMITKALEWDVERVSTAVQGLEDALAGRGIQLVQGEDGYGLAVAQDMRESTAQALRHTAQPLSQSVLETLTIVAYQQPVTKAAIDEARGVASDASLKTLLARDLIVSLGMKDGEVRYRTTNHFLHSLGVKSLEELPTVKGKQS